MKKQKIILCINIFLLCLISIMILSQNKSINGKKKMIKEMSESTQVSDLNAEINQLNKSHTEYANYIQTSKQAIATALTNEGVTTSENDTLETMANNIPQILKERTKDATATAEDIAKDKTAYVNGEIVTGTGADKVNVVVQHRAYEVGGQGRSVVTVIINGVTVVNGKITDLETFQTVLNASY